MQRPAAPSDLDVGAVPRTRARWQNTLTNEALISVWQQVLVQNVETVEREGRRYFVKRTSRHRLCQVDFTFAGEEWRGLEQNPETSSRWAKLARVGKKIMQFLRKGHSEAVVVDGQVFTFETLWCFSCI